MIPAGAGWLRAAVAVGLGAAVVLGVDAARPPVASEAGATVHSDRPEVVRQADLVCVGAPLTGAAQLDDVELPVSITAAGLPPSVVADLLPEAADGDPTGSDESTETADTGGSADPDGTLTLAPLAPLGAPVGQGREANALEEVADAGDAENTARPVALAVGEVARASGSGQALMLQGSQSAAAGLVAVTTVEGDDETVHGLATRACSPPTRQAWLVAGGGEPGRVERIHLTNPGANPVTADIEVLGAAGPADSGVGRGVAVAPFSRATVLLDAVAPGEASPVVHVRATGGSLVVDITDVWRDGTRRAGLDVVGPTAAPATQQVIPAVVVNASSRLRVAAVDADAVVEVEVLTDDGIRALPAGSAIRVGPRAVAEVPLRGLGDDVVSLRLTSDAPVVAGVVATVGGRGGVDSDIVWSAAVTPTDRVSGAVAAAGTHELILAGDGQPARATLWTMTTGRSARATTVQIGADAQVSVPVPAETAMWVRPQEGAVHAALLTRRGDGAGTVAAVTTMAPAPVVTVRQRMLPLP